MACKAPPIWCSAIFIVVGVVIAVLAVVPWIIIPNAIEDRVVSLGVIDSEDHEEFDNFANPPENPLIYSCYFWNITNPTEVETGGVPKVESVGPYVYKRYQHRFNITFEKDGEEVLYREWGTYYFYDNESFPNANPEQDKIYSPNVAYLSGIIGSGFAESAIAARSAQLLVFSSLKDGLTNVTKGFAVNILNSAWPQIMGGLFAAVGSNFAVLQSIFEGEPAETYSVPIVNPAIIGTNGSISLTSEQFEILFNSSVQGSLLDLSNDGVNSWLPTNAAVKIGALTQSPFNLSPTVAQQIFGYRVINPAKQPSELGGIFYGNIIGTVCALKGISGFDSGNLATWVSVLPNFGYRHIGRFSAPSEYGIIQVGSSSLSIINLDPATNTALFGNIPEITLWVSSRLDTFAPAEFGTNQPEASQMDYITDAQNFPQDISQWILDTFSSGTSALPTGAAAIGVYLNVVPLILSANPLYTARNFTLVNDVWDSTILTNTFAGGVTQQLGVYPFAPLPSLTFRQAFQLYAYLKYNILGSIVRSGMIASKGGVILETTAHEWLFGRTDTFLSSLLGTTYPVGGVWGDFNEELALEQPLDRYTTGKKDPKKARIQLTYEEKTTLGQFYNNYTFDPPVKGSSLTFVGPYALQSKTGKKTTEPLYLWVPNVVRELELIYSKAVSLKGIDLYRYIANARYESVVQSDDWINPYDFVMNCKFAYTSGFYDFYLTFPGWTLVKEKELFNDLVEGVDQDNENWILTWDIEPITGIAMAASAPLQLSVPIGFGPNWNTSNSATYKFDFLSSRFGQSHLPVWYIVRSNQISDDQADTWKSSVKAGLALRLGLTIALPIFGFVLVLVGVILIVLKIVGGKGDDMQEFELRT